MNDFFRYNDNTFIKETSDILNELIICFGAEQVDKTYYEAIKQESSFITSAIRKQNSQITDIIEAQSKIHQGGLSLIEVSVYLANKMGKTHPVYLKKLFDLFIQNNIIEEKNPLFGYLDGLFTRFGPPSTYYSITNFGLLIYLQGLIENVIYGFAHIYNRYEKAIIQVLGKDKNGDKTIGTGFLVKVGETQKIITCKHNIDGIKELHFVSYGVEIQYTKINPVENIDCAMIDIENQPSIEAFKLSTEFSILSDVITMGYPIIPQSGDAYLMIHKGEINGVIKDYNKESEYIIFSAKTSSGNSGSPLINKFGVVIGMVTNELFDKSAYMDKGKPPYFAAIPSSIISSSFKLDSISDSLEPEALSKAKKTINWQDNIE